IGLLVMIPTRRLFAAGFSTGVLTSYYVATTGLGLLVSELRGPAKFLIPILVAAYAVPFIITRPGVGRWLGRSGPRAAGTAQRGPRSGPGRASGRPPIKNVTPPFDPSHADPGELPDTREQAPGTRRSARPTLRLGRRMRPTTEEADSATRAG
ncbi:MAG TPA: hypothetical protein VNF73_01605, partial [Candidatus Saccharimonadales bacterium]|nr:hypothetical protein [Candidatus Saccharimonadales bacterium]